MVLDAVFVLGSDQTQQRADQDGQYLAGEHQHQSYPHTLRQHAAHWDPVRRGLSQISLEDVADVEQQLLPQRLVQAKLSLQLRDVLICGRLAGQDGRRITGRQVNNQKADTDDGQDHRYHLQYPPRDVLAKFHIACPLSQPISSEMEW